MVGVRFRRAIFPGYSDTVQYSIPCPGGSSSGQTPIASFAGSTNQVQIGAPARSGKYTITAILQYRKIDQFLLNYLFGGEANKLTAPVTEIAHATATVTVTQKHVASLH
jgi:hypothetical protein